MISFLFNLFLILFFPLFFFIFSPICCMAKLTTEKKFNVKTQEIDYFQYWVKISHRCGPLWAMLKVKKYRKNNKEGIVSFVDVSETGIEKGQYFFERYGK